MALAYAMVIEVFVHKEMRLVDFYNVVLEASKLGGSLFPVLAVALSLNIILIEHRIPQGMVAFIQAYIDSPIAFMLLVNVLLLVVGCGCSPRSHSGSGDHGASGSCCGRARSFGP